MFFGWLFFISVVSAAQEASKFMVYRAESSSSEWHTHLLNVDAANEDGVLGYVHSEVIPTDMGSGSCCGCKRKFDIDVIMRFQVTVLNPASVPTPPTDGFMAYDRGVCTVPHCDETYKKKGYYVGGQFQKGNPRHNYSHALWYSFPQEGLCWQPDGSHNCTFLYRPAGVLRLDDLVNFRSPQITPNYHDWCQAGGVEFMRDRSDPCVVQRSIPFWAAVCNATACQQRSNELVSAAALFNTSMQNGCDSSTEDVFKHGSQCQPVCPYGTFPDWEYVCQPCNPALHCRSCSWQLTPSSPGGQVCLTCGSDFPVKNASGACVRKL
mmetsp:Transcript_14980/g.29422  ORF Transcript_14980/g.29422 Transcript_14980/m.29422 type:complete len:322 (+) Transcript_14980:3-968(+)